MMMCALVYIVALVAALQAVIGHSAMTDVFMCPASGSLDLNTSVLLHSHPGRLGPNTTVQTTTYPHALSCLTAHLVCPVGQWVSVNASLDLAVRTRCCSAPHYVIFTHRPIETVAANESLSSRLPGEGTLGGTVFEANNVTFTFQNEAGSRISYRTGFTLSYTCIPANPADSTVQGLFPSDRADAIAEKPVPAMTGQYLTGITAMSNYPEYQYMGYRAHCPDNASGMIIDFDGGMPEGGYIEPDINGTTETYPNVQRTTDFKTSVPWYHSSFVLRGRFPYRTTFRAMRVNYTCVNMSSLPPLPPTNCRFDGHEQVLRNASLRILSDPDGAGRLGYPSRNCVYHLRCPIGQWVRVGPAWGYVATYSTYTQYVHVPQYEVIVANNLSVSMPQPTIFRQSNITIRWVAKDKHTYHNGLNLTWSCGNITTHEEAPITACMPRERIYQFWRDHDYFRTDPTGDGGDWTYSPKSCWFRITCRNESQHIMLNWTRTNSRYSNGINVFAYDQPHGKQYMGRGVHVGRWYNHTVDIEFTMSSQLGADVWYRCVDPAPRPWPYFAQIKQYAANVTESVPRHQPWVWGTADGSGVGFQTFNTRRWRWFRLECQPDEWLVIERITGVTGYEEFVRLLEPELQFAHGAQNLEDFVVKGFSTVTIGFYEEYQEHSAAALRWNCTPAAGKSLEPRIICPFYGDPLRLTAMNGTVWTDPDAANSSIGLFGRTGWSAGGGCRYSVECPAGWSIRFNISVGGRNGVDLQLTHPTLHQPITAATKQTWEEMLWYWNYANITAYDDDRYHDEQRYGAAFSWRCMPPGHAPEHTPDFRCSSTDRAIVTDTNRTLRSDWDGSGPMGYYYVTTCLYELRCPDDLVVRLLDLEGGISPYGSDHHHFTLYSGAGYHRLTGKDFVTKSLPLTLLYPKVNISWYTATSTYATIDGVQRSGFSLNWTCALNSTWDNVTRFCPTAANNFVMGGSARHRLIASDFDGVEDDDGAVPTACVWTLTCRLDYTTVVIDELFMDKENGQVQLIPVINSNESYPEATAGRTYTYGDDPRLTAYDIDLTARTVKVIYSVTTSYSRYRATRGGLTFSWSCQPLKLEPRIIARMLPWDANHTSVFIRPNGEIASSPSSGVRRTYASNAGSQSRRNFNITCPSRNAALVITVAQGPVLVVDEAGKETRTSSYGTETIIPDTPSVWINSSISRSSYDDWKISWECRCRNSTTLAVSDRMLCGTPLAPAPTRGSDLADCAVSNVSFTGDNFEDGCLCRTTTPHYLCSGHGTIAHGDPSAIPTPWKITGPRGNVLPCICQCEWPYSGPRCHIFPEPWPIVPTATSTVSVSESESSTLSDTAGSPSLSWTAAVSASDSVVPTDTESPSATPSAPLSSTWTDSESISRSKSQSDSVSVTKNPNTAAPPRYHPVTGRTLTHTLIAPVPFVPSVIADILGGGGGGTVTAATVGASVGGGGPAAAADMQALGLVGLVSCMDQDTKEAASSAKKTIVPWAIGTSHSRHLYGWAVIVAVVLVAHSAAVALVSKAAPHTFPSAFHAAVMLRLPDPTVRVAHIALAGLTYEGVRVVQLDDGSSFEAIAAALTAVGLIAAVLALTFGIRNHIYDDLCLEPYSDVAWQVPPPFLHPVLPPGYWMPTKHRNRFAACFDHCRPGRLVFVYVLPARAIILSALAALEANTPAQCRAQLFAMTAVMACFVVTVASTMPYRRPYDAGAQCVNAFLAGLVYCLPVMESFRPYGAGILMVATVTTLVTSIGAVVMVIFEVLMHAAELELNPKLEEELDARLKEARDAVLAKRALGQDCVAASSASASESRSRSSKASSSGSVESATANRGKARRAVLGPDGKVLFHATDGFDADVAPVLQVPGSARGDPPPPTNPIAKVWDPFDLPPQTTPAAAAGTAAAAAGSTVEPLLGQAGGPRRGTSTRGDAAGSSDTSSTWMAGDTSTAARGARSRSHGRAQPSRPVETTEALRLFALAQAEEALDDREARHRERAHLADDTAGPVRPHSRATKRDRKRMQSKGPGNALSVLDML